MDWRWQLGWLCFVVTGIGGNFGEAGLGAVLALVREAGFTSGFGVGIGAGAA